MKGIIHIHDEEEAFDLESDQYYFVADIIYDYSITIFTTFEDSFLSLISNEADLKKSIDSQRAMNKIDSLPILKDTIFIADNFKNKEIDLLKNAEYIAIHCELSKVIQYIQNNPILNSKKIVINDELELNEETLMNLKNQFGDYTSNLYFLLTGNTEVVNFEECLATIKIINNWAKEIEQFNFSPLEKIMYAYDLVRNRVYVAEGKDEDYSVSRDLTKSLLGDKIVCLGYANIFDALLRKLNINSQVYILIGKEGFNGHARNLVRVIDNKYNVDGMYFFDATGDSKSEKNDNYLYYYKYFAKTKKEIDKYNRTLNDIRIPYFSNDMVWEFEDILNEKEIDGVPKEFLTSINFMSKNTIDKELIHPFLMHL